MVAGFVGSSNQVGFFSREFVNEIGHLKVGNQRRRIPIPDYLVLGIWLIRRIYLRRTVR